MEQAKYFLAIVLPPPLLETVESIKQELYHAHGLKGALRSPSHITLHRPFSFKVNKENDLVDTLSKFHNKTEFEIGLQNFSFFEPRVVFVNVEHSPALSTLHEQLCRFCKINLQLFNESDDERGFHPHVTVAFRDLKKDLFYKLSKEFAGRRLQGSFMYSGFSLLRLRQKWEVLHTFTNR